MPRPKDSFEALYPCDFYTPAELLDEDRMYTVYEIARMLQGLEPDAVIDEGTEEVLLDWAIPWVMVNAGDLVVAEPPTEEEPGYYGLRTEADVGGDAGDVAPAEAGADAAEEGDDRDDDADATDADTDADANTDVDADDADR